MTLTIYARPAALNDDLGHLLHQRSRRRDHRPDRVSAPWTEVAGAAHLVAHPPTKVSHGHHRKGKTDVSEDKIAKAVEEDRVFIKEGRGCFSPRWVPWFNREGWKTSLLEYEDGSVMIPMPGYNPMTIEEYHDWEAERERKGKIAMERREKTRGESRHDGHGWTIIHHMGSAERTEVMRVRGGRLYRTQTWDKQDGTAVALCFVPENEPKQADGNGAALAG